MTVPAAGQLARLRCRGFWLEYASMAWMTAEAAVAVAAGVIASSIALVGFGLDSVIEFSPRRSWCGSSAAMGLGPERPVRSA